MEYAQRAVYGENHKLSYMMHDTVHGVEGDKTLCGKELGPMWFIVGDERQNKKEITCRECIKANAKNEGLTAPERNKDEG